MLLGFTPEDFNAQEAESANTAPPLARRHGSTVCHRPLGRAPLQAAGEPESATPWILMRLCSGLPPSPLAHALAKATRRLAAKVSSSIRRRTLTTVFAARLAHASAVVRRPCSTYDCRRPRPLLWTPPRSSSTTQDDSNLSHAPEYGHPVRASWPSPTWHQEMALQSNKTPALKTPSPVPHHWHPTLQQSHNHASSRRTANDRCGQPPSAEAQTRGTID